MSIAQKPSKRIIGLMSGTSLDGLDIALCQIEHAGMDTTLQVINYKTVDYAEHWRTDIKRLFAQKTVDLYMLSAMNAMIGSLFAEMLLSTLDEWKLSPADIDLIASHGQTIFHGPKSSFGIFPNNTLQIGDGDHLAVKTGIITVSDFRQKHVAAGGEGAPLVAYGDQILFSDSHETRILLNIGGIANFTYLPTGSKDGIVVSTDVGPGNTLMNQYMQSSFQQEYDKDGALAAQGLTSVELLQALLSHPFFKWPFPKTTGPELFNIPYLQRAMEISGTTFLQSEDIMATLNAFTAYTIAEAVKHFTSAKDNCSVYISGGGLFNHTLVNRIKRELPNYRILPFNALGMPPEAKEAALFALLANELISGNPDQLRTSPGAPKVSLGKISFPN